MGFAALQEHGCEKITKLAAFQSSSPLVTALDTLHVGDRVAIGFAAKQPGNQLLLQQNSTVDKTIEKLSFPTVEITRLAHISASTGYR